MAVLPRHDELVKQLARIHENTADQRFVEFVAERVDLLKIANAVIGELEYEDAAIYDVVTVARFLTGEDDR